MYIKIIFNPYESNFAIADGFVLREAERLLTQVNENVGFIQSRGIKLRPEFNDIITVIPCATNLHFDALRMVLLTKFPDLIPHVKWAVINHEGKEKELILTPKLGFTSVLPEELWISSKILRAMIFHYKEEQEQKEEREGKNLEGNEGKNSNL